MEQPYSITQILADGATSLNIGDMPQSVVDVAKRCLIDVSGVTLAGSLTVSARAIRNLARDFYGQGKCHILGDEIRLNAAGAALANAAAAHALDFDDNCYAGVVHGSAVVFPAVFAAAQQRGVSGELFLEAFISGLEIEFALGKALTPSFYKKGWWTTSVLGGIGAAAGAAHIASLDQDATARAISFAAGDAGGIRAVRGTTAKHYYCGRAAENGVLAAALAVYDVAAPMNVFEDHNGFQSVLNNSILDETQLEFIGKKFALEEPGIDFKRIPICFAGAAAADATQNIMEVHDVSPVEIERIVCIVPPLVASNLTYTHPATGNEAQFSLEFAIAATLQFGQISLDHLNDKVLNQSDLMSLMRRIEMRVCDNPETQLTENEFGPEWADVILNTKNGAEFRNFVGLPKGSAKNPLSDAELDAKFLNCATRKIESKAAENLLGNLRDIESIPDVRSLF